MLLQATQNHLEGRIWPAGLEFDTHRLGVELDFKSKLNIISPQSDIFGFLIHVKL